MSFWDLVNLLETDWTALISSVSASVVAIVGAIGAILVRLENNKRRENCSNPKCCITRRPLKKKASSNAKPKK